MLGARLKTFYRIWPAFLLALSVATCRDNPNAPVNYGPGYLSLSPRIDPDIDPSSFGIVIDTIGVRISRLESPKQFIIDTMVFFHPDSEFVDLGWAVSLRQASEMFRLTLFLKGGGFIVFSGTDTVLVSEFKTGFFNRA